MPSFQSDLLNPLDHPICWSHPRRLTPVSAWHEHIPYAMFAIDILRPATLVELGTASGDSYCAFCQAVDELNLGTQCYAVDTWQGDTHAGFYGEEVLGDLRAHHDPLYARFSHLLQSTFDDASAHFPDGSVDLLHIDGCHTYQAVRHDLDVWLPKMSARGVVLMHDIAELKADFGVWRVWKEITLQYPHFEFSHGHGLGVLAVGQAHSREFDALLTARDVEIKRIQEFFFQLGRRLTDRVRAEASALEVEARDRQIANMQAELAELRAGRDRLTEQAGGQEGRRPSLRVYEPSAGATLVGSGTTRNMDKPSGGLALSAPSPPFRRWLGLFRRALKIWSDQGSYVLLCKTARRLRIGSTGDAHLGAPTGSPKADARQYQVWMKRHALTRRGFRRIEAEQQHFLWQPKVSLLMTIRSTEEAWLRSAIESVREQAYTSWELCLTDISSDGQSLQSILDGHAEFDSRIKLKRLSMNRTLADALNEAFGMATGEYVGLLDCSDKLSPDALFEVVKLLNAERSYDIIYSDEDFIGSDGARCDPLFKPDWSPTLLMSGDYIGHLCIYRHDLLRAAGGFRSNFEGALNYDLALRASELTKHIGHISRVLYHGRLPPLTRTDLGAAHVAGRKVLENALERRHIHGRVGAVSLGQYAVRYDCDRSLGVSVIIPTHNRCDLLRRCLESIVAVTDYGNYEILIVDNGSDQPATLEYLSSVVSSGWCRVLPFPHPFNYSRINNLAARHVSGEYLVFLNNDTEVMTSDWLTALLEHAQQPDVGAVGARLLYPDGRIQHAGVVLGIGGLAAHVLRGLPNDPIAWNSYSRSLVAVPRECGAVTGACMMVRADVFREIGGFEEKLSVAFNDIDLCLRLRQRGYRVIYTPFARLSHTEYGTRGPCHPREDEIYFRSTWARELEKGDPYYNSNLTLE